MIRYLGDPDGMNAIFTSYSKRNDVSIIGPIPKPLSDWHYDYISATFADKPGNFGFTSLMYLYALSLDVSPRSRELLSKMVKTAKRAGADPFVIRAVSGKSPAPSMLTTMRFDTKKAKAQIEIYVNFGPLAEEVYHVVLSKISTGWNFISVSKVLET